MRLIPDNTLIIENVDIDREALATALATHASLRSHADLLQLAVAALVVLKALDREASNVAGETS